MSRQFDSAALLQLTFFSREVGSPPLTRNIVTFEIACFSFRIRICQIRPFQVLGGMTSLMPKSNSGPTETWFLVFKASRLKALRQSRSLLLYPSCLLLVLARFYDAGSRSQQHQNVKHIGSRSKGHDPFLLRLEI